MLLGCSNLTGRFWSGSLWYFIDPDAAPDVEKCLTGIECETGVTDGKFLEDKQKVSINETNGKAVHGQYCCLAGKKSKDIVQ